MLKFALVILVLGIVTYGAYSLMGGSDTDATLDDGQIDIHATLRSSEIYPKSPYTNNSLQIRMERGTQEDYGYLSVEWFRNGARIEGVSGNVLESGQTFRGDRIHALVNVLGPDALSKPVKTASVEILNSPPRVITASTSLQANGSDVLGTRIDATDPDGDALNFSYKWYRNNSRLESETDPTLDIASFSKDDEFFAEIVVSDGQIEAAPYRCDSITLSSNAPKIVSSPPSSFTEDRRYVYQLMIEGSDPGSLTYEIVKGPGGMTVSNEGLVDWALPEAQLGARSFEVVVRVSDPTGGEVTQSFSIGLSGSN